MTRARKELVHLDNTPYYHCISRCVRRAFLCGRDPYTGRNYEHRRGWVLERLRELQGIFAVEICAYAVMSNHYHLVLRLSPDRARAWSDAEIAQRWGALYSIPPLVARSQRGEVISQAEQVVVHALIEQWRERLMDLSWFMRCLNERIARRCNAEDACKGRFWEGRFKSQALLDEAAVLTCMSYVDLNPIRAGIADTPEVSYYTSIRQRVREMAGVAPDGAHGGQTCCPELSGLDDSLVKDESPNRIGFSVADYLMLVDWCGRAIRQGKRGAIQADLPPILERLNIDAGRFLDYVRVGRRDRQVIAIGRAGRLREVATRVGRCYFKGATMSRRLYPVASAGRS